MDQSTIIIITATSTAVVILLVLGIVCFIFRRKATLSVPAKQSRRYVHLEDGNTNLPMDQVQVVAEDDDGLQNDSLEDDSLLTGPIASFLKEQEGLPSYKVVKPFVPKRRDELTLNMGDLVTISMTFTDGWVHGYNHTTRKLGMFPISSVAVVDRKHIIKRQKSSENAKHPVAASDSAVTLSSPESPSPDKESIAPMSHQNGKGKLLFSMVHPEVAMEIVSESLSAERRAHYFETLLRDAKSSPSPKDEQTNPLESQLRASLEGAAGQESKAKLAWRKLRVGWKEAVRRQLADSYDEWLERRERFDIWAFMAENHRIDNGTNGWSGSDEA